MVRFHDWIKAGLVHRELPNLFESRVYGCAGWNFFGCSRNAWICLAAGQLLLSLIPTSSVRSAYIQYSRSTNVVQPKAKSISAEAMGTFHRIYEFLLHLMPCAMNYADAKFSQTRLVSYFTALRACLIGRDEKRMVLCSKPSCFRSFLKMLPVASQWA